MNWNASVTDDCSTARSSSRAAPAERYDGVVDLIMVSCVNGRTGLFAVFDK